MKLASQGILHDRMSEIGHSTEGFSQNTYWVMQEKVQSYGDAQLYKDFVQSTEIQWHKIPLSIGPLRMKFGKG
jgi:hypothetical protein